ncbi:MAG: hypothetical protein IT324_30875 [Anaerolineae bacterium]|nr:hypothetical protein [Anaerolineae bacterium]
MKLYSYCLRYDNGAAPNPYGGICTLAICKPAIRKTAQIGDWIVGLVGLGSANSPIKDISNHVVYAMKVTSKLTMREYDTFCSKKHPEKIPEWNSANFTKRVGDCIYKFQNAPEPELRESVHDERNRKRDLGGEFVLISEHFYYFGKHPILLHPSLEPIIHRTQGHKSDKNQDYVDQFVEWITNSGFVTNELYGEPQLKKEFMQDVRKCAARDLEEDEQDSRCA